MAWLYRLYLHDRPHTHTKGTVTDQDTPHNYIDKHIPDYRLKKAVPYYNFHKTSFLIVFREVNISIFQFRRLQYYVTFYRYRTYCYRNRSYRYLSYRTL